MTIDKIVSLAGGGRRGAKNGNTVLNRTVQVVFAKGAILTLTAVSIHPDRNNMALDQGTGQWYDIDKLEPYRPQPPA